MKNFIEKVLKLIGLTTLESVELEVGLRKYHNRALQNQIKVMEEQIETLLPCAAERGRRVLGYIKSGKPSMVSVSRFTHVPDNAVVVKPYKDGNQLVQAYLVNSALDFQCLLVALQGIKDYRSFAEGAAGFQNIQWKGVPVLITPQATLVKEITDGGE